MLLKMNRTAALEATRLDQELRQAKEAADLTDAEGSSIPSFLPSYLSLLPSFLSFASRSSFLPSLFVPPSFLYLAVRAR